MAIFTSYDVKGNKEAFAPFVDDNAGKSIFYAHAKKIPTRNKKFNWVMDYPPTSVSKVVEGSDASQFEVDVTHQFTNVTQIYRGVFHVSKTLAATEINGKRSEFDYQVKRITNHIKHQIEADLFSQYDYSEGSATTPRKSGGLVYFASTGGGGNMAKVVEGTIDEASVKEVIEHLNTHHSTADTILVGAGAWKELQPLSFGEVDGVERYGMKVPSFVDYNGKVWGVVFNDHLKDKEAIFCHPDDFELMVLRDWSISELGSDGSYERYLIEIEYGYRFRRLTQIGIITPSIAVMAAPTDIPVATVASAKRTKKSA